MTKKVLLYLRNSADTLRTACADSQRHFAEIFMRKNGWKLELICRDEDIGEVVFTAQPGVHKLLNEIEFGSSDIVLCHTLDRLCSRLPDAARLLHDLTVNGMELWAADPGIRIQTKDLIGYYCNDPGKPLAGFQYFEEMPDGLYDVNDLVPLPYGYRYTGAYDSNGTYVFGFKAGDKECAKVVRRIFRMYADGMSPAKIAEALNAEGIPGPRGGKWRDTTIRGDRNRRTGILNNEIYIGRSWVPGRNYDSAYATRIVSDELWRRVKLRQGLAARGPVGTP
ncbi:recombinase family protein [Rhizobium sp. X9]|uniref:recombinase family protein n=1 Tax=Rhizobium sp. X9 TaxID=2815360 RepID=UPI001C0C8169|nr:recombinase family protein [Rhizobium sp. X9]